MIDETKCSIATMADGAAIQMIDEALEHAYANIRDPNTEAKQKRVIDLKITLMPDAEREIVVLDLECTKKFANNGLDYTSSAIQPVVPPQPKALMLNTLESIAKLKGDCFNVDASKVILLGAEDDWKRRAIIAEATAIVPSFQCNGYQQHEQFILWVLTHFEDDEERARLLSFAGNIRTESVQTSEDDGVTQVAAVKRGAKLKEEGWKNPVILAPFRTFDEVAQPKSRFIFRIRDDLQMGLFSVEDQAWRLEAMRAIRDHLVQLGVKAPIYL